VLIIAMETSQQRSHVTIEERTSEVQRLIGMPFKRIRLLGLADHAAQRESGPISIYHPGIEQPERQPLAVVFLPRW
jgi:hypothetical protein